MTECERTGDGGSDSEYEEVEETILFRMTAPELETSLLARDVHWSAAYDPHTKEVIVSLNNDTYMGTTEPIVGTDMFFPARAPEETKNEDFASLCLGFSTAQVSAKKVSLKTLSSDTH